MDVLEIDAATHTGIDNVREVIISGLAISPVRDRYKIFIIDEVHQLSPQSFNALLKSVEEPPPHVVFIMATTELGKIPVTILSRAQVFEFRAISVTAIAAQLRRIADAEGLTVSDEALVQVARAAEGSMRDAQSALDQIIAFAGTTITPEDVSTVLGLVGRDLLFEMVTAVADEHAAAAFTLAGRAVEAGYDLKLVCRELTRLSRDLLLVAIDASRAADPDVAMEAEREQLIALSARFSREDLLRSFDLLARAETEIRASAQPRYHLEMALLRWIHLRKLVPIEDVLAELDRGGLVPPPRPTGTGPLSRHSSPAPRPAFGTRTDFGRKPGGRSQATVTRLQEVRAAATAPAVQPPVTQAAPPDPAGGETRSSTAPTLESNTPTRVPADVCDRFLSELKRQKPAFFGMVVAQAQAVEWDGRRLVFTFGAAHENLRQQIELRRAELEALTEPIAGHRLPIATAQGIAQSPPESPKAVGPSTPATEAAPEATGDLRAHAMADTRVQALLEVFPAEIRDVEDL
jgi:DNA polymerase-3 subunit gamma/tau